MRKPLVGPFHKKRAVIVRHPAFQAGCRGFESVSRSPIYIVSLLAGEKAPGDNQAAIWQARRRCFYGQKGVQRHPAFTETRHPASCPSRCPVASQGMSSRKGGEHL